MALLLRPRGDVNRRGCQHGVVSTAFGSRRLCPWPPSRPLLSCHDHWPRIRPRGAWEYRGYAGAARGCRPAILGSAGPFQITALRQLQQPASRTAASPFHSDETAMSLATLGIVPLVLDLASWFSKLERVPPMLQAASRGSRLRPRPLAWPLGQLANAAGPPGCHAAMGLAWQAPHEAAELARTRPVTRLNSLPGRRRTAARDYDSWPRTSCCGALGGYCNLSRRSLVDGTDWLASRICCLSGSRRRCVVY